MVFNEENVTIIAKDNIKLKGTLTLPKSKGKLPAVLIINGSGGADRDGSMKKPAMISNIYKEIAHVIANLGIIVLRYDKRGVGESEGNTLKAGMLDLVNDIESNVQFLREDHRVDANKIILVGHSEGCILATLAHRMSLVNGLVLLSGAGTGLIQPIRYQNDIILSEIERLKGLKGVLLRKLVTKKKVYKQIDDLVEKMRNSSGDTIRIKGKKMPAKWMREHFDVKDGEILNILKEITVPVLVVTGNKDAQVDPKVLKTIESLKNPLITCEVIPNMDHMLKEFDGKVTVMNLMKQYKKELSQPMHPVLKSELSSWIVNKLIS